MMAQASEASLTIKKFSSGDNGGIYSWNIDNRKLLVPEKVIFPTYQDQYPSHVIFLTNGDLLVITSQGRLFLESSGVFGQVLVGLVAKNITLVKVNEAFLSFGDMNGEIKFYRIGSLDADSPLKTVVWPHGLVSTNWLDRGSLLACGREGKMKLFTVGTENNSKEFQLLLPSSRERVATATCWVFGTRSVVVGDRDGSIFLYCCVETDAETFHEPVHSLRNIHSKQGVSDVISTSLKTVLSAGRDGSVRTYHFDEENKTLTATHVLNVKVGWVARFLRDDLELAFQGNQFVIKTGSDDRVLASIKCGGAQRSWDYLQGSSKDVFAFIKERTLYRCHIDRSAYGREVIKPGFHTRTINTAIAEKLDAKRCFLVSGSEDTTIRLSWLENCALTWSKKFYIHRSSVRAIAIQRVEGDGMVLVSGGGRAEICVSKILLRGEETSLVRQTAHLLRGLNARGLDPETRYNSLKIVRRGDNFKIFAACSDGAIRQFSYSSERQILSLLSESNWHNHCVLQVKVANDKLLSAATDGRIAVWGLDTFPTPEPELSLSVHQSGVNDFDHVTVGKCMLIASCGDDNALQLRKIGDDSSEEIKIESAHSAQITGLKFLDTENILTVSADQRIGHWAVGERSLRPKSMIFSQISDIQGLCVWDDRILVYGNGFEIHKLSS